MSEEKPEPVIIHYETYEKFFSWLGKTFGALVVFLLTIVGLAMLILPAIFSLTLNESFLQSVYPNAATWFLRTLIFVIGSSSGIVHIVAPWLLNERLRTLRHS
jgi:hypothetical protein